MRWAGLIPIWFLHIKKGEAIGRAVPYDIQETNNGKVKLVLEPGAYHVILQSMDGKAVKGDFSAS